MNWTFRMGRELCFAGALPNLGNGCACIDCAVFRSASIFGSLFHPLGYPIIFFGEPQPNVPIAMR
jgi:hypothetical protein